MLSSRWTLLLCSENREEGLERMQMAEDGAERWKMLASGHEAVAPMNSQKLW